PRAVRAPRLRDGLGDRLADDVGSAAVVRSHDHALAGEDGARPAQRVAGADPVRPAGRNAADEARLAADDDPRRRGAGAADAHDPGPLLERLALVRAAARARLRDRGAEHAV